MIGKKSFFYKLVFVTIFLSFIIETVVNFFDSRDYIILFQTFISLFTLTTFFIMNKVDSPRSIIVYLSLLCGLLFFLGIFSSDIVRSYNFIFKFVTPLLYLVVGFNMFKNSYALLRLISKLWIFLLYFVLYVILANVFGFGESFYDGALISVGYMNINATYVPVIIVLAILFLNKYVPNPFDRTLNWILSVLVLGIIILMLKRTLLVLFILGFLAYFLKNFSVLKLMKYGLFFLFFVTILFFNFSTYLSSSFEARKSRFSEEYSITDEGRFIENFVVFEYFSNTPKYILLGTGEVFNDSTYMYEYFRIDRNLHNSFIRIIWSSGIVGFVLFIMLYIKQFSLIRYQFKFPFNDVYHSDLFYFGLVIIIVRFINDFSSGITYLSYNILSYLIIGGIISLGYQRSRFFVSGY